MSFNLFGPATNSSIKVGYISTDRGFVDGISVCEANDYAKLNPGTRFIFRTRDSVRYLGINDVNKLTPDDLASSEGECPGLQLESNCGPAQVYFYGGGGVGVKANPVIGQDGSVLAVDLVSGGFGYQYPPIVEIKDNCEIGAGVLTRSILGEVAETVEYYDQESDFEEYEICDPSDSGFGRRYGPNGEDLGPWDPTVYTKLDEDPIRREIQKYQDFLRKGTNPWWTTRLYSPLRVTAANKVTRNKFDVTDATFLKKQLDDGVKNPVGWNSFMNTYAISPVPPSNVKGSDYAGTTFTFEWEENFPYEGEYVFRGLCDNSAQLYLDNELIDNLRGFRDTPNNVKRTITEGVHTIRLDLYNAPIKEVSSPALPSTSTSLTTTTSKKDVISTNKKVVCSAGGGLGGKDDSPQLVGGKVIVGKGGRGGPSDDDNASALGGGSGLRNGKSSAFGIGVNLNGKEAGSGLGYGYGGRGKKPVIRYTGRIYEANPFQPEGGGEATSGGNGAVRLKYSGKTKDYTKPGTYEFEVPSNVDTMEFICIGGGGSGYRDVDGDLSGSGGSGGAYAYATEKVRPGTKLKIVVGAGGQILSTLEEIRRSGRPFGKWLKGSKNGESSYIELTETKVTTVTNTSTNSKPKVVVTNSNKSKNVFNTIDYIGKANRKLWRTFPSVGKDGSFLQEFGVTPFKPDTREANTNSFAGTHTINWTNINFPVDGNYSIELMVDDAVTLTFSGPGEQVVITKRGFSSQSVSTGKTTEVRFFKAGKYTIKADLQQASGKGLAQGNPMALAISINRTSAIGEKTVPKSWNENPMGVALVIDAPQPPIPQEPVLEQEGRCPRNPIWSTRFPGSTTKWYPVNFSSPKTVTETITVAPGSKKDSNRQNVEFTIYGQGAFRDLAFVFTSVTGGHTFTLKGVDKNKKTRKETISILKNTNYVVYAKEDSKKYTSVEQGLIKNGTKDKEGGAGQGKKIFADYIGSGNDNDDIQISVSSGSFKSSNKRKVSGTKGRNTYDLTYKLEASPSQTSSTTTKTTTYQVPGWSRFMNRYAISPIPPLATDGTDGGGVVYRNTWSIDIPYDGFYGLRGTVDNFGRISIDGREVLSSTKKSPVNQKLLNGFMTENPDTEKVFLTRGIHSIAVEVENQKTETVSFVDHKIFSTDDWQHTPPPPPPLPLPPSIVPSQKEEWVQVDDAFVPPTYQSLGGGRGRVFGPVGDVVGPDASFHRYNEGTWYKGKRIRSGGDWNDTNVNSNYIKWDEDTRLTLGSYHPGKGQRFGIAVWKKKIVNTKDKATIVPTPTLNLPNISYLKKGGVTYIGPELASYRKGFISPKFANIDDFRANFMGKTWNLVWNDVDFPEDGQYDLVAEADDEVIVKVGGVEVGRAKVFGGQTKTSFSTTKGKKTVELILTNIPGNNRSTFDTNPVVAAVKITRRTATTIISKPWTVNPIGISAILIPPPCPKIVKGKGVVVDVEVDQPGNGYPVPQGNLYSTDQGDSYPVSLRLKSVVVENPGINYNCGVDQIQITPSNGAVLDYECDSFGRISAVKVLNPGLGFTRYPEITMVTPDDSPTGPTGVNASFRPQFEVVRDPIVIDPEKLIQVTDLVGLKQTGYVDGRSYFGAVFYKEGIRYAGFYETPGELVQVYDTLQESIEAQVTTRPSAILRQGTDINSNNPRLNLPGTPENLI